MSFDKNSSDFEVASHDTHLQGKVRNLRRIDGARAAVSTLALCMGIVIVGVSANSLYVYNATHVRGDEALLLSVWPNRAAFDIRPTIAFVVGSSIIVLANMVGLSSHHNFLRSKLAAAHTPLMFMAPFVAFVAALIAMVFFYAVNTSRSHDTLLSWTCRWRHLDMYQRPHFGSLCRTSRAGVYLSILLIPVEAVVLCLAVWQLKVARFATAYAHARKTPSPVPA